MTDTLVIRLVVVFLGVVTLAGVVLGGYLAATHNAVPDFIIATTSGALGALAGILAKTNSDSG